jgi:PPOX class probable F420-dependent enzyme
VALKHRLANASYRFLDRMRHKTAFDSEARSGVARDFAGLRRRKHALLVTFRQDGTAVPTPVWFALLDDRRLVVHSEERTAKVRRVRRDPRAQVFPCDPRGKVLGPGVETTVRMLAAGEEREQAEAALDDRYGRARRVYHGLMFDHGAMVYLELSAAPHHG